MRRSTGVTINAIVLLLASVAGFLFLLILLIQGVGRTRGDSAVDNVAAIAAAGFIILMEGIPCWGFATGIGLLRLRRWARTCSVVVSAIVGLLITLSLVLFGIVAALSWHDADRGAIGAGMIVMILVWALAALYCGWWAHFFQTRSVKEQFGVNQHGPVPPPAVLVPAPTANAVFLPTVPDSTAKSSGRPASITVVAAFLLIGTFGVAMSLPAYAVFHPPVPFFGFLLSGWRAVLVMLATGGVAAAAAFGLFKLRLWARTLAIYFLAFGLINTLVTLLRPGSIARLEKSTEVSQLQFVPNQPGTEAFQATAQTMTHAFMRILLPASLVIGVVLGVVQIWLLVTRKQVFIDANQSPTENS
jgi:hypothetical protein